jgi:multidrug efflux pump subunit AcrA (membrane-fusion protein)
MSQHQDPTTPDDSRRVAHEPPPPGAHFMNVLRWVLFAGLLLLAVASIGSYVAYRAGRGGATAARQARYHCPMHPTYTSDRPGQCPICGMDLEPIPAGGGHDERAAGAGDVPGLTSVHISPERVQLIGVRTARVERRPLGGQLELVGFVTPDESRLRRVQLRVAGWVQQLHVSRTGEATRAGQPLLSLYSPELYQSEQEFLIALGAGDSTTVLHEGPALASARGRLRLLGVPDEEISRLERERTASTQLTLRSPFSGTVLERGVAEGQYVAADTPLLTLADLSRIWVLADLYEMDYGRVKVGDAARFVADAMPGRPVEGRVEFVYPTVSTETRTLKLRMSLDNPGELLRPGMYGRVRVSGRTAPALAVPVEAIVNAGENDYVFLAHADGHFEPRIVRVGLLDGERAQILTGLAEGDTVVASASFLIDSESRLKAAIAGMGKQPDAGHQH